MAGVLKIKNAAGAWEAVPNTPGVQPLAQGVMYNASGVLATAPFAEIDGGDLQLVAQPYYQAKDGVTLLSPTPAAGRWKIVNVPFGNTSWPFLWPSVGRPMFIPPSGIPFGALPGFGSVTFPLAGAGSLTVTGSFNSAPVISNTTPYTRQRKLEARATTNVGGIRSSGYVATMGGTGTCGFFGYVRMGTYQNATTSTKIFAGLMATSLAATDVEPSTLTNLIGMGYDSTDTYLNFIYNDASGTASKQSCINGGSSYFGRYAVDGQDAHELIMYQPPGVAEVNWLIQSYAQPFFVGGVATVDLPAPSTPLYLNVYVAKTGSTPGMGLLGTEWWTLY